jgi:hypothetical protein
LRTVTGMVTARASVPAQQAEPRFLARASRNDTGEPGASCP